MMVAAAVLIMVMLLTSAYAPSGAAGWVAVVGASIVFGSTGVPMKTPALKTLQVDSFVFALYNSIGIFMVTLPLVVYLAAIDAFVFKPWAILGAADICVIGYLAFMAVQILGYCKAPAIWAGCGMICAFLWGALGFNEPISDIGKAAAAIVLLIFGVYSVSTSQGKVDARHEVDECQIDPVGRRPVLDDEEKDDKVGPLKSTRTPSSATPHSMLWQAGFGYLLCFAVGFFDGSLLVPYKLSEQQQRLSGNADGGSRLREVFQYIASFGISSLFVSPTMFAIYCLCTQRPFGTVPALHLNVALLPGISSGVLWATANFMSVHATYFLGMKIGFPLTQTCVLFAAAWGVLYFKEFELTLKGYLIRFVLGISAIILGAYLLGDSG